jgi:hypothetical protein
MEELKADAEIAALDMELNWEKLENPEEAKTLVEFLDTGISMLPVLESLYTKLTSGKSVVLPDEDSPLPYEEIENYTLVVAEELHAAYMLQGIKDKYDKVNQIIQLSGSL